MLAEQCILSHMTVLRQQIIQDRKYSLLVSPVYRYRQYGSSSFFETYDCGIVLTRSAFPASSLRPGAEDRPLGFKLIELGF